MLFLEVTNFIQVHLCIHYLLVTFRVHFFKMNFNSLVQVNFLEISIICTVTNETNVQSKIWFEQKCKFVLCVASNKHFTV
jgi:hypothetical protein